MRRLAAILFASTIGLTALAQPPVEFRFTERSERSERGEKGGGGFGGRMMMGGNFDEMFDRFAKGKNVIRRDDLDPMMQMGFDMMARRMNITGNEITRDQAKQFSEQMQSRNREGGGGMGGVMSQEMTDRFTEEGFRRRDRNGDGLLDASEMSDGLKAERDKWDTNKDGFIDLNEYKGYARARFGDQRGPGTPTPETPVATQTTIVPQPPTDGDPDYRRPTVLRFGHLPKELPEWFAQLDTDQDGQVALHEWVKGGRTVEKFREMDGNDDDFVIAEEVIRFQNGGKINNFNMASAYNSENREPAYRFNRDGGGRGPRGPGGGGGDRNSWMGGGNNWGGRGNGGDNNSGGRSNWMNNSNGNNGAFGGWGGWGNRGPGGNGNGNGNQNGGDRPRGGNEGRGPMEKGMGKGGFEKGMGKGGRDRSERGERGNGNANGNGSGRP